MSNRVVEIMARAQADYYGFRSKRHDEVALAIIAALESEGAKVMWREPTEEIAMALAQFLDEDDSKELWRGLFDAAPRYGKPSRQ